VTLSLRARLVIVVAVLAAVGLAAANVATYAALRSFLVDRFDGSLEASAAVLTDAFKNREDLDLRQLTALTLTPDVFLELRDEHGQAYESRAFGGRTPVLPATLSPPAPGEATVVTVPAREGGSDFRVRVEPLPFGNAFVVAAPLDDVDATLRRLALIALLVSLAVVGAIVGLGLWLVRVAMTPLGRIEETAAAISAGDLTRRIDDTDTRTEVGRLGVALNSMLGHIETAFSERAASEQRLRRFVADASHELRTPLSSVQAYAELFERGARERPDDLERAMAGIEREARRMGVLVEDLLLLARLDQGRPLERRRVDLNEIAADAVDAARAVEPGRPIELEAADRVAVTGDPARLRQVVDNLLANVRAHVPPRATATVRVLRDGERAVLEVADDGPGLRDEQAARVFERFYRADPSRARSAGGSGLGLAIVSAIAAAHGGEATVASTPGRGATFRVALPVAEPAVPHDGPSDAAPEPLVRN
jgi:two-component system OmpR family sensor kinase